MWPFQASCCLLGAQSTGSHVPRLSLRLIATKKRFWIHCAGAVLSRLRTRTQGLSFSCCFFRVCIRTLLGFFLASIISKPSAEEQALQSWLPPMRPAPTEPFLCQLLSWDVVLSRLFWGLDHGPLILWRIEGGCDGAPQTQNIGSKLWNEVLL